MSAAAVLGGYRSWGGLIGGVCRPNAPQLCIRRPHVIADRVYRLAQKRGGAPTVCTAAPSIAHFSSGWPLWSTLAACAAVSQVVERRTPIGAVLSAPLVSMLAALCLAAAGVIPTAAPAFDTVWTFVMPLAAALCLLESDLRKLWGTAASTLLAFLVGAVGTVLGTVVAFWLVGSRLGPEGYKIAASLCASYIGGSVNFAQVAQGLSLAPGPLLAGAMTADNIAMAGYFAVIMSIPAEDKADGSSRSSGSGSDGEEGGQGGGGSGYESGSDSSSAAQLQAASPQPPPLSSSEAASAVTAETASLGLAAAAVACTLGNSIAAAVGFESGALAVMALVASGLAMAGAAVARRCSGGAFSAPFAGAEALGGSLMMVFFATIGAGAGSLAALRGCGWLLAFIGVQLSVHLGVCLGVGKLLLRLPMRAVLVASNANVGGSATAAAFAGARGWRDMVQAGMLTGALGYAIATAIGVAMGHWLRTWRLV